MKFDLIECVCIVLININCRNLVFSSLQIIVECCNAYIPFKIKVSIVSACDFRQKPPNSHVRVFSKNRLDLTLEHYNFNNFAFLVNYFSVVSQTAESVPAVRVFDAVVLHLVVKCALAAHIVSDRLFSNIKIISIYTIIKQQLNSSKTT